MQISFESFKVVNTRNNLPVCLDMLSYMDCKSNKTSETIHNNIQSTQENGLP